MEKKNTAAALGFSLWKSTFEDESGGVMSYTYDPYPMLFKIGEWSLQSESQPLLEDIEASAKERGISLEEMQGMVNEAVRKSIVKHVDDAAALLKKQLPEALKLFLTLLANGTHIEVMYTNDKDPHSYTHLRPAESYNEAVDRLAKFFSAQIKTVFHAPRAGRPIKWTRNETEKRMLKAAAAFRKRKYRLPTLAELSKEMKVPEGALTSAMKRHSLSWKVIKKLA